MCVAADGLRADKLFEQKEETPFLRSIIENKGSWGISHTRVPTESRPGHVAMISGFYEDVSAVTKGWKDNPVEFDSLFNQSTYTWSWGSPDILPMFAKRTSHMSTYMYPPEYEDFSGDSTKLDRWVFEKFEEFIHKATEDAELHEKLNQDKIVLFFHLLGVDTAGHAKRPYSQEYIENIRYVDKGVEKLFRLIEKFFNNDGKTSYIFTSDHGMSNKGSHGDGEIANTETPIIAWGSGVSPPKYSSSGKNIITAGSALSFMSRESNSLWNLGHLVRYDISQADIAPLMATLLGVPIPVNSVGIVPLEFISLNESFKLNSLFDNAKQILTQLQAKENQKKETSMFFRRYKPLDDAPNTILNIEKLIENQEYRKAETECKNLIQKSLQGLNYYQTYDWPFLMAIVLLGYLGWISFLSTIIIKYYTVIGSRSKYFTIGNSTKIAIAILIILYIFLWKESSPIFYYIYVSFPAIFWAYVFECRDMIKHWIYEAYSSDSFRRNMISAFSFIVIIEILVLAFFFRELFSLCFIALGIWVLIIDYNLSFTLRYSWIFTCLIMALFPIIPPSTSELTWLVILSGIVCGFLGLRIARSTFFGGNRNEIPIRLIIQSYFTIIASIVLYTTESSLSNGSGLPIFNQFISWILFIVSFVFLFTSGEDYQSTIASTFLSLSTPYILLSISYEVVFYIAFSILLMLWIILESKIFQNENPNYHLIDNPPITFQHIRIAVFYILFCFVAFFGTGNIASYSSFELSSTYRFITVFNPFLMGALLIVKVLIPFTLLSAVLGIINRKLKMIDEFPNVLAISILADVMSINFFFLVKDSGSWLDIGLSISRFGILNAFMIFQMLLLVVSHALLYRLKISKSSINKEE